MSSSSTPAFALLHGGGQGSWVWDATMAALRARGAEVVALDVPGSGTKRARSKKNVTLDDIAHELNAELAASRLGPVMLVGHSLAGALLPRMAEYAPSQFASLVYLSCTAVQAGRSYLQQMGTGLHGEREDEVGWPIDPQSSSLEERYRAMFCNDMDEAQADAFLAQLGEDMWPFDVMTRTDWRFDHLDAIPSTYILCARDNSLPLDWQHRFAEQFRCKRLLSIDAGHQAMTTQPEVLAALLTGLSPSAP